MVFNESATFWVFFSVCTLWLVLLSAYLMRMIAHYNRMTAGVSKSGLRDILEQLVETQEDTKKDITAVKKVVQQVVTEGKRHIQKVGIVRFNPFHDTGGSQSFTMAMLDGGGNGVVLTSLFARTGHRWYIKEVSSKQGRDIALSKEEEEAIKKAQSL